VKLRRAALAALGLSFAACTRPEAWLDIEVDGNGSTRPPAGSHAYQPGSTVKVTATPGAGAAFSHWSGAATGTANPASVVVEDEEKLVAHFSANTSGSSGASGSGSTSGSGSSSGSSGSSSTSGSGSSSGTSSGSSTSSSGSSSSGSSSSSSSSSSGSSTSSSSGSSSGSSTSSGSGSSSGGGTQPSAGCGKTPTLKSSSSSPNYNTITSGGKTRQYLLRLPANYDNNHPYRLILGFHGATGSARDVGPSYFGLFDRSNGSTVFAAPDAVGGIWSAAQDTTLVDDMLEQIEGDLCIDKTRVEVEGFSQGGAMAITLACARPNVFRVALIHSAGGLPVPSTCQPVAWLSTLGNDGSGQTMTSDFFARTAGCTVETLPRPPSGGHLCSDYKGCSAGHPVRWCPYDGGHTPSHVDSGQRESWVPAEVWTFLSQF
jgi:poly(3-hydroxybutyrate) depolymerase